MCCKCCKISSRDGGDNAFFRDEFLEEYIPELISERRLSKVLCIEDSGCRVRRPGFESQLLAVCLGASC